MVTHYQVVSPRHIHRGNTKQMSSRVGVHVWCACVYLTILIKKKGVMNLRGSGNTQERWKEKRERE